MPKKTSGSTPLPTKTESYLKNGDPRVFVDQIDEDDDYLNAFTAMFSEYLEKGASKESVALWDALGNQEDGSFIIEVERAARKAGFLLGFEYCRRLLTGGVR